MYLESLDKVAKGKATKIVLPLEVSKMAESITKRTGGAMGSGKDINVPPEVVQRYSEMVDNYDKRLKDIESKLTSPEGKEEKNPHAKGGIQKKQLTDKTEKQESKEPEKKKKKALQGMQSSQNIKKNPGDKEEGGDRLR